MGRSPPGGIKCNGMVMSLFGFSVNHEERSAFLEVCSLKSSIRCSQWICRRTISNSGAVSPETFLDRKKCHGTYSCHYGPGFDEVKNLLIMMRSLRGTTVTSKEVPQPINSCSAASMNVCLKAFLVHPSLDVFAL